jgi:hypothetical protein
MQELTDREVRILSWRIAAELSTLRGERWTPGPGYNSGQRKLAGPTGEALYLAFDRPEVGRVSVCASYPRTRRRVTGDSITVAHARGGAAVAREINRRILPEYLVKLSEVRKYNETQHSQYDSNHALATRIAELFGQVHETSPYEPGASYIEGRVHLRGMGVVRVLESGNVALDFNSLPADVALHMLGALASCGQPSRL